MTGRIWSHSALLNFEFGVGAVGGSNGIRGPFSFVNGMRYQISNWNQGVKCVINQFKINYSGFDLPSVNTVI